MGEIIDHGDNELGPEQAGVERGDSSTKDFFDLKENEFAALKAETGDHDGAIRIFVHPYFEGGGMKDSPQQYERLLQHALKSEKVPPVFIMEETREISKLKDRLRNLAISKAVYVVPTFGGTSEPHPKDGEVDAHAENWKKLIDRFKMLGVKKIIIGGREFVVSTASSTEEREMWGCVAGAIENLSNDFEVDVSNIVFPSKRKDYKNYKEKNK